MKKRTKVLSSLSLIFLPLLTACDITRDFLAGSKPNRPPVIASFDYSPKSKIGEKDIVTFSVVANDPEGQPLQYNWSSTRGTLSGNSGSTITWKPLSNDGKFETGNTTVSVIVSDAQMTTTASVNILINEKNEVVEVVKPSVSPAVTPVPSVSASPSATPSPATSASPSATPVHSVTPSATPSPATSASPTTNPVTVVSQIN